MPASGPETKVVVYTSPVTGGLYDYRYTLEIDSEAGHLYRNFKTLWDVKQYRKEHRCAGKLYTPDGYPVQENL